MSLTVRESLARAVAHLEAAGVDTPRLDAELLLAHALGRNRTWLAAHLPDPLPAAPGAALEALLARRAAREPLPYLLGEWEWLGLPFRVTPAVLIPRPETETLVEEAARHLPPGARLLDVGAGSGCVAVGLARLVPGSRITALEPSPTAAAVARENATRHGDGRVVIVEATLAGHLAAAPEPYDGVVSNPPYIPTGDLEGLAPEVRDHEPRLALDGGPDGLMVLRELAAAGPRLLRPGGLLAVEVGAGQAPAVQALLQTAGHWETPTVSHDLAGIERVVITFRCHDSLG